ncbi:hypothetical protein MT068_001430 [Salmonella enterica]|nr:hypothetical protein [Salmonella enterica]
MTIKDLIEAARNIELTDEDKARITLRLKELEKSFEKQAEALRPTAEMLNRLYTL